MKIIDFDKRGNVIRLYLGKYDLENWWGDDWDDVPYEHNAGGVYEELIDSYADIALSMENIVLEPSEDWHNQGNSRWSKEDMIKRKVPCLVIYPLDEDEDTWKWEDCFNDIAMSDKAIKIYFGDTYWETIEKLANSHINAKFFQRIKFNSK